MGPYLTIERIDSKATKSASPFSIPLSPNQGNGGEFGDAGEITASVIENGRYAVRLVSKHGLFGNPKLLVLDSEAGISTVPRSETIDGELCDVFSFNPCGQRSSGNGLLPFLLHHDFINLSVVDISPPQSGCSVWHTPFFQCLCENDTFSRNVETILQTLVDPDLEGSVIIHWMLREGVNAKDTQGGIVRGTLKSDRPKNLNGFIRLAREVLDCYTRQYPFFRTRAQHKIAMKPILVPYEKVRTVSPSDFLWLMHNGEHLHEVAFKTELRHGTDYFMPDKMLAQRHVRNYDFTENRIVVSFLAAVVQKTETVHDRLKAALLSSSGIGAGEITKDGIRYVSPLGTVRKWQQGYFNERLKTLQVILSGMKTFLRHYRDILKVTEIPIPSVPKMTKIFQEIAEYRDIYERIRRWFGFGEFAMENEEFLLGVKTLDKLLEYYGLFTILQILNRHGFAPGKDGSDIYSFPYNVSRNGTTTSFENELEVNNTYRLRRAGIEITVYCQCAIYSYWKDEEEWKKKANGIRISSFQMLDAVSSRTGQSTSYWCSNGTVDSQRASKLYVTPDFLLKIHQEGRQDLYIVMDAKFSRKATIYQHEATGIFSKYFLNLIPVDSGASIAGVWILQGRTDAQEASVRVTSPPFMNAVDFRIIPLDSATRTGEELWNSIRQFLV